MQVDRSTSSVALSSMTSALKGELDALTRQDISDSFIVFDASATSGEDSDVEDEGEEESKEEKW